SETLAAQRFEPFERASLDRSHQPRIPRHIGGEDRSETASGGHYQPSPRFCLPRLTQNPPLSLTSSSRPAGHSAVSADHARGLFLRACLGLGGRRFDKFSQAAMVERGDRRQVLLAPVDGDIALA